MGEKPHNEDNLRHYSVVGRLVRHSIDITKNQSFSFDCVFHQEHGILRCNVKTANGIHTKKENSANIYSPYVDLITYNVYYSTELKEP